MSLEQSIQNLADAIRYHADTLSAVSNIPLGPRVVSTDAPTETAPAAKRGRPAKDKTPESAPTEAPPPPPAAVVTPAATPAPVAGPVVAAEVALDKATVSAVLIKVVQALGKEACTNLCLKYGAKNLTGVAEENWPKLLQDANDVLSAVG